MRLFWKNLYRKSGKTYKKIMERYWRHPVFMTLTGGVAAALVLALGWSVSSFFSRGILEALSGMLVTVPMFSLLIVPVLLTAQNIAFALQKPQVGPRYRAVRSVEVFTVALGCVLSLFYFLLTDITVSDWWVQLHNTQVHSPVEIGSLPTVAVLAAVAVAGYGVLRFLPMEQQPPLLTVLSVGALYPGMALAVVWCVQLGANSKAWPLMLLPANMVIIAVGTIRAVAGQRAALPPPEDRRWLSLLSALLSRAWAPPVLGLAAAVPLLGILVMVLTLFGQQPDSVIRAWTHTADWTLSQRTAPQNIYYDEHYLCTVAAGGHRRLVRPLRVGMRHGHRVVVNRQLCVANAFEQLLEERLPRFHRLVRGLYDRLGYPLARRIRRAWMADGIYLMMKPLEWLFLAVLYLFDRHPENRIAVQYPHTPPPA